MIPYSMPIDTPPSGWKKRYYVAPATNAMMLDCCDWPHP